MSETMLKSLFVLYLTTFVILAINIKIIEARTSTSLKVKLDHGGVLIGRHLTSHKGRNIRGFLGVPYAKPPIDELRFRSPVPFGSWEGERFAINDSKICPQIELFRGRTEVEGIEDCLYLNVYAPEVDKREEPLPVMVWFHGGGFEFGNGMSGFYAPQFLLDRNIILVSANYRLGPLGFLSTGTLDCPGNFGLKDQVEVLKWIQVNIKNFGGNPNSVTIFGESAGGASITYLMISEKSKGLIHNAIAQSGTHLNPWGYPITKEIAVNRTRNLSTLLGCNDINTNWTNILNCLRTKPANDFVTEIRKLFNDMTAPIIVFPPVVEPIHEDAFITKPPEIQDLSFAHTIPLMLGLTAEDGLLKSIPILQKYASENSDYVMNNVLPTLFSYDYKTTEEQNALTKQLKEFYFAEGEYVNTLKFNNLTDLMTDGLFTNGIDEMIRSRITGNATVGTYVYLFEHEVPASLTELANTEEKYYGACHSDELQYLFPIHYAIYPTTVPTKCDIKLREIMLDLWVNFAKNSNPTPTGSDMPIWQTAHSYPYTYMHIGNKQEQCEPLLRADTTLWPHRLNFWQHLKLKPEPTNKNY